jgi:transcriptional regulator with XRE-family HTH domain
MKTRERLRARKLRAERGYSIKQIARLLGVSTSSVSLWVRDIELTNDQHAALRQRSAIYDGQLLGRAVSSSRRRAERRAYQEDGRRLARQGEVLHAIGCMLYWAEGSEEPKLSPVLELRSGHGPNIREFPARLLSAEQ